MEPVDGGTHRARSREVGLVPEVGAGDVIAAPPWRRSGVERGRADPGRIRSRAPRIVLVAAYVIPSREVTVVVLTAGLEQVRVVRHEHGGDARRPHGIRDGVLPDLDGSPGTPQEVECAHEDVVAGRHAGE